MPRKMKRNRSPRDRDEIVDEASNESFPASDPPAWILTEGSHSHHPKHRDAEQKSPAGRGKLGAP